MWEGESMQRDGVYWLVCAASRVDVDNAEDEAVALRVCGGSQLPCAWDEGLCELVVQQGELGLLKWMRAQKPPCPCDFWVCLRLAEENGGVRAYLQRGLDLLYMCGISSEDMTATETADAVALIDQGADVNVKNIGGWTPLHRACRYGLVEVAMALLEKGADLHAKTSDGQTPLHRACVNGHAEVAMALLEKGADVHVKDNIGWTPLHNACYDGRAEVVQTLLEKGADLHAEDKFGQTPLHIACMNGHAEVAMALLEKGADLHAKNSGGQTSLHWACLNGHDDIAAMLRENNAGVWQSSQRDA
jgi:ankyrin repeat protein